MIHNIDGVMFWGKGVQWIIINDLHYDNADGHE